MKAKKRTFSCCVEEITETDRYLLLNMGRYQILEKLFLKTRLIPTMFHGTAALALQSVPFSQTAYNVGHYCCLSDRVFRCRGAWSDRRTLFFTQ
jgi:hypothetical protein